MSQTTVRDKTRPVSRADSRTRPIIARGRYTPTPFHIGCTWSTPAPFQCIISYRLPAGVAAPPPAGPADRDTGCPCVITNRTDDAPGRGKYAEKPPPPGPHTRSAEPDASSSRSPATLSLLMPPSSPPTAVIQDEDAGNVGTSARRAREAAKGLCERRNRAVAVFASDARARAASMEGRRALCERRARARHGENGRTRRRRER